ncbi:hemagglutinin repeat-containing protein [Gallibacterium anatis]|uniref:two-partner secretion domain-containing protein n=1 Tax=Gallibacterium anatis TaxID=750 RepID=UPI00254B8BA7|nr:hemagglutinin repeat-containing protein [Gallibacterium anatis]WIM84873.1 hemagglutinin repeat-containing protein [Gallibacterium anatis]
MNKHLYRIIFNKRLQRLVVVSEIATREGKAKHQGQHYHTASLSQRPHWRLKALTVGLYSLLGFFYLTSAHADELQIRADNTAPKNQQPIVLQTANGLPQVNIQTPNNKGLSHNKYQQFDVAQKGAILNNSRKNTQTEQGGWVQANPYLVGGEAKVILNEVNATKPSQLKGYIEVAGGKADVIIANPSGIHCEGCGIINAGRSTLTTGEVQIENGEVKSYRVEKGSVTVSGRGFDSSRQDYTDIIAKEVKVNAGIWANNLKVTTGKNKVSKNNDAVQVIHAGAEEETAHPVGYAVDVAELGGMYANKIHLIGTENGLGVRNAGHIGAAAGEVKITTEGQLVNTGYLGAKQDITLQSQQQIENQTTGVIYSQQGNLQATSKQKGIQQQGSLIAKGKAQGKGNITLKAKETISQSGESLAEGNITYQAKNIETHPTAKLIAGGTFTHTAQGEQVTIPAYHSAGNVLNLIAEETILSHGKHLASTQITAQAKQLDFSQSGFLAYQADLTATQNNLVLDQSHLELKNTLHLSTPTHLSSQQANLQAAHIFTTASSLDNRLGTWINRDQQPFNLRLLKGINNQQGQIFTQGSFNLVAQEINNQQGLLFAKGNLTLNSQQTRINNQQGVINTEGQLDLQSGELINDSGLIQSLAAMNIDTHQQRLSNQATKQSSRQQGIISFDKLTVKTGELINQNGFIANHQAQKINASRIINSKGVIQSDHTQHLVSQGAFNNTQGEIVASNDLFLDTGDLNNDNGLIATEKGRMTLQGHGQFTNWQGNLLSQGDTTITVFGLDNAQQGLISSSANLTIDTHQALLRNEQGVLFAQQRLLLNSGELNNQQGLIQGQRGIIINTHHHSLNNKQTQHQGITSQGDISLHAITSLTNHQGNISANGNLDIQSEQIDNQQGNVSSQQLSLTGETLDNRQGTIQTQQNAHITAHRDINNQAVTAQGSVIQSGAALTLITNHLNNQGTKATTTTPTQGLLAHQLALNSDQLDNQQGGIYTTALLNANVTQDIQNQQGEILSLGDVSLQGDSLTLHNQQGLIESGQYLNLVLKQFDNEGNIKSHQDASITLQKDLILTQPFAVNGHLSIKTAGDLINQTQLVTGKGLQITAKHIENPINSELSAPKTKLIAESLTNRGLIDGTQNIIHAAILNNLGTGRIYGDVLAIQSHVLNNQPENDDNIAATIAARQQLDLGVGTLTNRDHALILSLGNLAIGGKLDKHQQATGQADFVDNGSATIEAQGNGKIDTKRLWNHDLHLITGEDHQDQRISEYAVHNKGKRYSSLEGWFNRNNNNRHDKNSYFNFNDGRARVGNPTWVQWHFNRHTVTTTLEHRDPAKLLIAGDLRLNGEDLVNDVSQILVGNRIRMGGRVFNQNEKNRNLKGNDVRLENKDLIGEIHRHDEGTWYTMVTKRKRHGWRGKKVWAKYGDDDKPFSRDLPVEYFKFHLVENTIGQTQAVASQASQITIDKQHQASTLAEQALKVAPVSAIEPHQISTPVLPKIISVEMSQAIGQVRTYQPEIRLPEVSLYRINPQTDSHILVETDPRFANKRKWLSSDYMFDALRAEPQTMLKRLGDGYYEQRLINEQINQLTGQRFLGNYTSDYEQYKALMDAGIRYAKQHQLMPGITLSAAQMKELTEDMVWLAPQTVTLKDGTQVQVLVPQVYLVKRDVDIQPTGAVISAREIEINNEGDVKNSGVIAGRDLTHITAQNLTNSGAISAKQLNFNLANRFYQQGGQLSADNLQANAGSIQFESLMSEANANGYAAYRQLDQQALVKVKQALLLRSQGDIEFNAVGVKAGNALLYAAGNINIGTVTESERANYVSNAENYWKFEQKREIGSTFDIEENAVFSGKQGVTLRAAQISSGGDLLVHSEQGDIQIQTGRHQETLSFATKYKDKSLLSRSTTIIKHDHQYDLAEGSNIDGENVSFNANNGALTIQGSSVVAENKLIAKANNITIKEAENRIYSEDFYSEQKSGLMGSGGIGFSIGSKKETTENDQTKYYASGSQVGSLKGNTTLLAQDHYRQQGSTVSSLESDVNIGSKKVDVLAADDKYETHYKHIMEQKGFTIAVNSPVVQAAQNVMAVVEQAHQVGESKNNRINALAAANTAWAAMRATESVGSALSSAQALANGDIKNANVSVSLTYGEQKNVQTQHIQGNTATNSAINAGGNVTITATGADNASDINIVGSDVSGKQGTRFLADDEINFLAAKQTYQERSNNKSSGWNAGVSASYGSDGFAFGVTAGGNDGKGYGNGDETTWRTSHIGDKASNTVMVSGGNTTVKGAQVLGKNIISDVENLTIASVQDTISYSGKQKSISGQATVGYGASVSANYNQSKINADYASVQEQSGLFAGDEGYQVNVRQHTDLTGGLITSTAQAEADGKNSFSTGTLSHSDIQNYSNYSASGFSLSGGVTISGGDAPQEIGGMKLQQVGENHKDGSSKVEYGGVAGVGTQGNWGIAKGLATALLGQVNDKGSESSVTNSAINTKNIVIRDNEAQLALTGKSAAETAQAIQKDNFHQALKKQDVETIRSDLESDLNTATEFVNNTNKIGDEIYYRIEKNEQNIYLKHKKASDCDNISCIKTSEIDVDRLSVPKTKEEAEQLARLYVHGIMNQSDEDRTIGAIQYGGKEYLNNDTLIVRRAYSSLPAELTFTIFERLRGGLDMPSIFGASNASRDQAKIWGLVDEYNRQNPTNQVNLSPVNHSLGASGTKNAMNWAKHEGMTFKNTTLNAYVVGTSYPITNNTLGATLSGGLYDKGYTETAAGLFRDGSVEYASAPRDIVATGINLPFVPGDLSIGIGNTNTTGNNSIGIPLWDMIMGHHTKAYYRDEESIRFLNTNEKGKINVEKIREIEKYQKKVWGQTGPKTETIEFSNGVTLNNTVGEK